MFCSASFASSSALFQFVPGNILQSTRLPLWRTQPKTLWKWGRRPALASSIRCKPTTGISDHGLPDIFQIAQVTVPPNCSVTPKRTKRSRQAVDHFFNLGMHFIILVSAVPRRKELHRSESGELINSAFGISRAHAKNEPSPLKFIGNVLRRASFAYKLLGTNESAVPFGKYAHHPP